MIDNVRVSINSDVENTVLAYFTLVIDNKKYEWNAYIFNEDLEGSNIGDYLKSKESMFVDDVLEKEEEWNSCEKSKLDDLGNIVEVQRDSIVRPTGLSKLQLDKIQASDLKNRISILEDTLLAFLLGD